MNYLKVPLHFSLLAQSILELVLVAHSPADVVQCTVRSVSLELSIAHLTVQIDCELWKIQIPRNLTTISDRVPHLWG